MRRLGLVSAGVFAAALSVGTTSERGPITLVACAPGFPGNTVQAASTMSAFARVAARAAGLPDGEFVAEYYEAEAAGLARMAKSDAALALVTLPFYAKHRDDVGLRPVFKAVGASGADEAFGLVARRGALASPAALEGWEIIGVPGFAPSFVRATILGAWGTIPDTVAIRFGSRVPSALIRAAEGERIAVLVDGEQMKALPTHPRAADLEVVARTKPLPASVLCEFSTRPKGREAAALVAQLPRLHRAEGGADALKSIRLLRFEKLDARALDRELGLAPRAAGKRP